MKNPWLWHSTQGARPVDGSGPITTPENWSKDPNVQYLTLKRPLAIRGWSGLLENWHPGSLRDGGGLFLRLRGTTAFLDHDRNYPNGANFSYHPDTYFELVTT